MTKSPNMYLSPLTKAEYINLFEIAHSEPYLKYDHPDRPVPSIERAVAFWDDKVMTGVCRFWGIYRQGSSELVGVINAFNFNAEKQSCETGINIYPPENFGKGYAMAAYQLLHEFLKQYFNISETCSLTNPLNKPAVRLYQKLSYTDGGTVEDEGMTWQVFKLNL